MPCMTWANGLTSARLAAAPVSAWAAATAQWRLALILFVIAVATDLLDGILARRLGQVSTMGRLLRSRHGLHLRHGHPRRDGRRGLVPWLLVVLIPSAFVQYTLDSGILSGRRLRTNALGKGNGLGYFVLPGTIIAREVFELRWLPDLPIDALAWLLVATTLVSMGERLLYLMKAHRSRRGKVG